MTFIRPDYGDHQAQHQEWLELTGLWEPCRDPDHKPAQGTVRFPEPVTHYPLDDVREPVEVRRKRAPRGDDDEGLVSPSCARRRLEIDAPPGSTSRRAA